MATDNSKPIRIEATPEAKALLDQWVPPLSAAIAEERRRCRANRGRGRPYAKQLRQFTDDNKLALIVVSGALATCMGKPQVRVVSLAEQIGNAAYRGARARGRQWKQRTRIHLGGRLLQLLIETAAINARTGPLPAFERGKSDDRNARGWASGIVQLTETAEVEIRRLKLIFDALDENKKPQFERPIITPRDLNHLLKNSRWGNRAEINTLAINSINAVNSVPWRINRRVLDVARKLLSERPEKPKRPPQWLIEKRDGRALRVVHTLSETTALERTIDLAERLANHPRFYFRHSMDFRGRMYPEGEFLQYQGDDLACALLELADPRPVTAEGRKALEIEFANHFGFARTAKAFKTSITQFFDDGGVLNRWAEAPLANREWLDRPHPWRVLATAFALHYDDAAPHYPARIDCTSSVLQHYAAALRDEKAADLSNILPSRKMNLARTGEIGRLMQHLGPDWPWDAYDIMAFMLSRSAPDEIRPFADRCYKRDILKTVIMTFFYGISKSSATQRVRRALRKAGLAWSDAKTIAPALTDHLFAELPNQLPWVWKCRDWLSEVAKLIAEADREVAWTSPAGIRIYQGYRVQPLTRIKICLQNVTYRTEWKRTLPINVRKQARSFPANFVHGLDASMMMLTVKKCRDAKVQCAGIHDCFVAHAEDIHKVDRFAHEAFIEIHSGASVLERLHKELSLEHPGLRFPAPPLSNTLDFSLVSGATNMLS
jgi:DNA-directed RNA polymerase